MKRLVFCLAVPLLFVMAQCGAQAQQLGIEGDWQAQAPTTRGNGDAQPAGDWTLTPQRLTLTTSSLVGATYSVRRDEPLPEGSWAMDVWSLQTGNSSGPESSVIMGMSKAENKTVPETATVRAEIDPDTQNTKVIVRMKGADGAMGDNSGVGAGPVLWLRLTWNEASQTLSGAVNGKPFYRALSGKIPARAPIEIAVTYPNGQTGKRQFIVAGFRVRAGSEETVVSPLQTGAAWRGWSPISPNAPAPAVNLPRDWKAALDRLSAPAQPARTRAFALGAVLLMERSASDATWKRVSDLVEKSTDLETDALAQILPLAAASAKTAAQRERALGWSGFFFDALTPDLRESDVTQQLGQVALLDPQTSALELLRRRLPYALAEPLANDLKPALPDLSFALWRATSEGSPLPHAAWHLPQWQQLQPDYAALLVERLRALADEDGTFSHPDKVWGVAAYRLANENSGAPSGGDLALALEFAQKIKDAKDRAQALSFATRSLDWPRAITPDATLEAALMRAIVLVKADPAAGSEAIGRVHLASYWRATGDKTKAAAALREVAASLPTVGVPQNRDQDNGEEPGARAFRDWFTLAREAQRLGLAEAASWWERARTEATGARMIGRGAIVLDGEPSFSSAQWLNGFARATNDLPAEWAQYLSFVIERDPARGAALWRQIEDESLRKDILVTLARGRTNRADRLAFAGALPLEISGVRELRDALADLGTLEADLARWSKDKAARPNAVRSDDFDGAFAARLQGLSPEQLLALEPAFGEQSALFARQMLGATALATGLSNDPIWQRATPFAARGGSSSPWGLGLRYAVRADIENARNRKENNEIYRIYTP